MKVTLYGRGQSKFIQSDTRKGVIFGCLLHFGEDTLIELDFDNKVININNDDIIGTVEEKE